MTKYWVCLGHREPRVVCRIGDPDEDGLLDLHRRLNDCLSNMKEVEAEP